VYTSNLKGCRDTCCDECGGYEVLGHLSIEVESSAGKSQGWGDDGTDHRERMLQTEEDCEENRDLIVESIEWCFVVLVLAVQGPDVGGNEVKIIL
jgi:hypothetical protein